MRAREFCGLPLDPEPLEPPEPLELRRDMV